LTTLTALQWVSCCYANVISGTFANKWHTPRLWKTLQLAQALDRLVYRWYRFYPHSTN